MTGLKDLRFYLKKGNTGKVRKRKFGRDPEEKKIGSKATKRHMRNAFSNSTYNFDNNEIWVQLGHIFLAEKPFAAENCKQGRKISIRSSFFPHKDRLEC